ncbi:MAG TPA: metal-dependent hydrolase [Cytophagaceae bacterium]|jgi:inner membrane protein|nr:metal-dependent hydrolase [Cytophagaceae bacterium]
MDSLTQIVLGAAVGEAILGRKVGNKAMIWGAIAGTVPDLDVAANFFVDAVRANELHRGFSHSILFSILFAPLLGWLAHKIHKKENASWKEWSWLMFGSLITHPLLDVHTSWGTQLFWPLDYKMTYNNIFVVDPLYTVPFMVFLILAMVKKRDDPKRRFYNNLGLIISSSYMLLTLGFKGIAHYHFTKSLQQQHIVYKDLEAKPTVFNSILWCGFVETENTFLLGYYSLFDGATPVSFISFPKKQTLLGKMANEDLVKRLIKLSRGWYNVEVVGDTTFFYDLRFGQKEISSDPTSFVYCYKLHYENGILIATPVKGDFKGAGEGLKKLFVRLEGK